MIVFDRYKRELCRGTFVRGREALVSLCQKMRGAVPKRIRKPGQFLGVVWFDTGKEQFRI